LVGAGDLVVLPLSMERDEPSLKPEWLLRGPSSVAATAARPVASSRAGELTIRVPYPFVLL
jgi:hypothetical protein